MNEDVWVDRLKRELWTLHEAACYFAGDEPAISIDEAKQQVLGGSATASAIYRDLKDAAIVGSSQIIRVQGWYGHYRIKPTDAILWARSRGYMALDALPMIPEATKETGEARRARLIAEVAEEKKKRTRNFNVVVAKRNCMSVSNLKLILGKKPVAIVANKWAGLASTKGQSVQRGRK